MSTHVDVIIGFSDVDHRTVIALDEAIRDAIDWERGTINATTEYGISAWNDTTETATWIAAAIPGERIDALRFALRVIAKRHRQDAIALTIGRTELIGRTG